MKPFGITGGVGCGKSTVSKLLSRYRGVHCLETDIIAKNIVTAPEMESFLIDTFGGQIFHEGVLVKSLLAEELFKSEEKRLLLEAKVHPLVWQEVDRQMLLLGEGALVVVESALLYEKQHEHYMCAVISVTCPKNERVRRLVTCRNMEQADIQRRMACQLSQEEKDRRADRVISTFCLPEELDARVANLYAWMINFKESLHD